VIAAGAAAYAVVAIALFPKWTVDDAFIIFRYARNLAEHGQLTWNPGQAPVEGYTGIVLALIVTAALKLGISPVLTTQAVGAASFLVGGVVLRRFLRRWDIGASIMACCALLYFGAPLFLPNALSGLETVLFSTVVLASLFALSVCLADPSAARGWSLALFLLLLVSGLVRPEGALLGLECLVALALATRRAPSPVRRRLAVDALVTYVGPGLAYFVWRWTYYGYFLPNTYYAKTKAETPFGLAINADTLWDLRQFGVAYLMLPILITMLWSIADADAAGAFWRTRDRARARLHTGIVGAVFAIGCVLQYARSGLVMNYSHRFFAPLFPITLVALAAVADTGVRVVAAAAREKPLRYAVLRILSVSFLLAQLLLYVRELDGERRYVVGYRRMLEDEHLAVSTFVKNHVPADEWLMVMYDAGVIPYYSGLPTVDLGGLNDPIVARLTRARDLHGLADYAFSFRPGAFVLTSPTSVGVTHDIPLTAAITTDERFRHYVMVGRFETPVTSFQQVVFLRADLVGR
jgi:hypothetical protein